MIELRDYEENAIHKLRLTISQGKKKVVMVMPTGAGKSVVFGQIISNALKMGKIVIWLVHRRNLVFQMQKVLKDMFGIDPGIIMSEVEYNTDRPVQLATIQTYTRRLRISTIVDNRFFCDADLVLIDEGHRSISKTYLDVINLYSDKIILTCTATPMRLDGRGLGEVYDSLIDVVSVDTLTKRGFLAPARYFAPSNLDLDSVKVERGDYVVNQLEKKVNTAELNGDVIQNWLRLGENRKTLVFAVNVKHSIALRDEFLNYGIPAYHLDARSKDSIRDDAFRRMQNGDIRVITNVGLYTEGLDVPDIGVVSLARPTKSMGLYRQMVGRSLRPSELYKDVLILDHSNCIREHGFVDEPIEWSLDGKEIAWKKVKPREKESRTVKCRVCHEIFKGRSTCPVCGTPLRAFGRKVETTDDELVELRKKKAKNKDMSWEDKRLFMGALKYYAEEKGYNPNWCAHGYRDIFSVWPNDPRVRDAPPIKAEGKTKNLLTHLLIKKAKRYEKQKAQGNRNG